MHYKISSIVWQKQKLSFSGYLQVHTLRSGHSPQTFCVWCIYLCWMWSLPCPMYLNTASGLFLSAELFFSPFLKKFLHISRFSCTEWEYTFIMDTNSIYCVSSPGTSLRPCAILLVKMCLGVFLGFSWCFVQEACSVGAESCLHAGRACLTTLQDHYCKFLSNIWWTWR